MKTFFFIFLVVFSVSITSCQVAPASKNEHINATITTGEFEKKLAGNNIQLIDVRSAQEFEGGHLKGAVNYDINSAEFENQIAKLDKNKPVLVYCLSGGRSASAAGYMNDQNFTEVYNLEGGLLKWSAAGKSLDAGVNTDTKEGLSSADFNKMLESPKFVLVDYNAKWCKPCVKMAPLLDSFAEKNKEKLSLLKIDADENKTLLREKGIDALPVLELYKNGKLVWKHEGEINAEGLNEIKL